MDNQREKFKAWHEKRFNAFWNGNPTHEERWETWQAALATSQTCVAKPELPPLPKIKRFESEGEFVLFADHERLMREYARAALSAYGQRAAQEPLQWTPGPNEWKDWCTQYFGPDADDTYLAEAVFNLPLMAQRFKRSVSPSSHPQAVYLLEQVMSPYGIYDIAVSNAGALQMEFIELGKQMRAVIAPVAPSQPQQEAVPAAPQPSQAITCLDAYDAGLMSDYGGGNVEWWQDYMRAELDRAHDHYQAQLDAASQPKPE